MSTVGTTSTPAVRLFQFCTHLRLSVDNLNADCFSNGKQTKWALRPCASKPKHENTEQSHFQLTLDSHTRHTVSLAFILVQIRSKCHAPKSYISKRSHLEVLLQKENPRMPIAKAKGRVRLPLLSVSESCFKCRNWLRSGQGRTTVVIRDRVQSIRRISARRDQ